MKPKVLVVFGSESGGCKRIAKKMAESWTQSDVASEIQVTDGNGIANEAEDIATIAETFDVLVVVTSSFGDGEPPGNFGDFLLRLLLASEREGRPLHGLQHAVLGMGSSQYAETFQNCPRLTDKYLEACGSRRLVPRHEVDAAGDEDAGNAVRTEFRELVSKCLADGLPAADSPAAEWSKPRVAHKEPTGQISEKTAAELGGQNGGGMDFWCAEQLVGPIVCLTFALCVAGYHGYLWYGGGSV